MRQVILYRDEDGYWVVECPSLKGCISQGKTKEEALANIKEAISKDLDDNFVSPTAADVDIVDTKTFEEIKAKGLEIKDILIDALFD